MCSSNTPPLCRCRARTGNRPPTCHEITQMVGAMQAMRVACAHHGQFYVRKYLHSPGSHLSLLLGCPCSAHVFPEKISTICNCICMCSICILSILRFLYCSLLTVASLCCLSAILHDDEPSYNGSDFLLLYTWWW